MMDNVAGLSDSFKVSTFNVVTIHRFEGRHTPKIEIQLPQ